MSRYKSWTWVVHDPVFLAALQGSQEAWFREPTPEERERWPSIGSVFVPHGTSAFPRTKKAAMRTLMRFPVGSRLTKNRDGTAHSPVWVRTERGVRRLAEKKW